MSKDLLIKVRENPYQSILDRERVVNDVQTHLRPWVALIEDLTNYGTNLIPRCFVSSERSMKDTVVLMILLRQCVAMLDGIEVLLSQGAPHSAQLPLRALFEASVYIEWILGADSERKARYYYVHNLRRKRRLARALQPLTSERQDVRDALQELNIVVPGERIAAAEELEKAVTKILSQPRFLEVEQDFETRRNGKKFDRSWYVPLGVRDLGTMARSIGKRSMYVALYSGASEVMHAANYEHHVKFGKRELTLEPIRSLDGFEFVFRLSATVAMGTFQRVLQEYRCGELPAFARKYVEKWQQDFLHFPEIKYEVQTNRI